MKWIVRWKRGIAGEVGRGLNGGGDRGRRQKSTVSNQKSEGGSVRSSEAEGEGWKVLTGTLAGLTVIF